VDMRRTTALALLGAGALGAAVLAGPAAAQEANRLCTDNSRACMVKTVQSYYEGLDKADGTKTPFGAKIRTTEQERIMDLTPETFRAEFRASEAIQKIRNVRMFVDEQRHQVVAFIILDVLIPPKAGEAPTPLYSIRRAHRFKVDNGLITEVEIINQEDKEHPAPIPALWPED
jgi:hypothetical protein